MAICRQPTFAGWLPRGRTIARPEGKCVKPNSHANEPIVSRSGVLATTASGQAVFAFFVALSLMPDVPLRGDLLFAVAGCLALWTRLEFRDGVL